MNDEFDREEVDGESYSETEMQVQSYQEFLQSKIVIAPRGTGWTGELPLHESLFPHQAAMVRWALQNGRGLIAASFGLGKSRVQCEIARQLHLRSNDQYLLTCPLGVKHQFAEEDGPAMGIEWRYVRSDAEIAGADTPYLVTNYERIRDGGIDPRKHKLCGASLDEGSVLRSLGSKTYQVFQEKFSEVPHRWVCTATPAPNKFRELIYYAQFLGVMDVGQALTRFFERDPNKAGNLMLHPQHEKDFWLWVASWALFLYTPSDLGFSDEGYDLPELRVHYHRLEVDHTRAHGQTDNRGQHSLLLSGATSVSNEATERRETLSVRIDKMKEILSEIPDEHALLWHHLEDERRAIEKAVPEAVSVYGSQELEVREQRILDFSHGKIKLLATKPEIAGSGCNFQRHCHTNIFLGVDYRFEDFVQAIHRVHRFQQKHPVDVHIIYAESQDSIIAALKQKWRQHDELTENMRQIVRRHGLSHAAIEGELRRHIGVNRFEAKGKLYTAINNDSVAELPSLPDNSVGLWHTSIPFGNHYEYTTNIEDFGHNTTDEEFFRQMDFLIPEMLRALKPGRIAAIHVKDRVLYGHQTKSGFLEIDPFSDDTVRAFRKHGFLYEGRRTIVTDVVRENNSTYRLGWSEMCRDSTKMGSGLPEYLLLFRKPPSDSTNSRADEPVTHHKGDVVFTCHKCGAQGEAGKPFPEISMDERIAMVGWDVADGGGGPRRKCAACGAADAITKETVKGYTRARWQVDAHDFWRSNGDHFVPADYIRERLYDYEAHVARLQAKDDAGALPSTFFAEPPVSHNENVWDDIMFMRCLNANQAASGKVKHICPLPLDIVNRTIELYSAPGDIVADPFLGLGTVAYCAVLKNRIGWGCELNHDYWTAACNYLRQAEMKANAPTLFDLLPDRVAVEAELEAVA